MTETDQPPLSPELDEIEAHARRDIQYVDGLEAHMDEGGKYSPANVRDLIAMVRWNAEHHLEARDTIRQLREQVREAKVALEPFAIFPLHGKHGGPLVIIQGSYEDMCDGDSPPRAAYLHADQIRRARTFHSKLGG